MPQESREDFVYRLIAAADWRVAQEGGVVAPSDVDRRDGYIHLSTRAQVSETARRYYSHCEDLVALELKATDFGTALKFELAPSRGEFFPHLYAALPTSAVRRVNRMERAGDGFSFGDEV
jgi:uncharacterized protein (DUF952 family)